jgi:asparaginyl-tRNA synthetase
VITASDAEGAGEMFRVSSLDPESLPRTADGSVDWTQDFFGKAAFLTVSGQLEAEVGALAFRNVYTFGPTFRAENSNTTRHLAEFWMIEPEMAFVDSNGNMAFQEEMVSFIVARTLERAASELEYLERDLSKLEALKPPFPRVSYTDAVSRLQEKGSDIQWGEDIGGADETLLSDDYDLPVFVFNSPKGVKAFYMKENPDDPTTVLCDDLIAPEGYGEIIGGSQREDDLDRLLARIHEEKLPEAAYGWYLDLRRFGTFPHSGFGLGLERTVAWITGRPHIRELIPFPRMINRLYP